ncbi:TPA: hypothetical protein UMH03_000104 [Stenotrophomonas maltophilia]|nr:hypothetical protein [Stenotrophomonas maltophilia]
MFNLIAATLLGGVTGTHDRLDECSVAGVVSARAGVNFIGGVLALFDALDRISTRDKFEFQLDLDGDCETVVDFSPSARDRLEEHFHRNSGFTELSYTLTIWKEVGNSVLSIYSLSDFSDYVTGESLKQVLALIGHRFTDRLIFECFEPVVEFGTGTIQFLTSAQVSAFSPVVRDRVSELAVLRENSHTVGTDSKLIPSDVYLTSRSDLPGLNQFFDEAAAALSVVFLANNTVLHDSNELEYRLVGYKSIVGVVALAKLSLSVNALHRIYLWAYSAGGNSDRIGLARNVISLHVECLASIGEGQGLWNAIQSNYQIYLKGNISAYLEVKSRIAELLVEASVGAHAAARNLVASLKGGIGVMGTFLLGVVVVNGVKDAGFKGIFSAPYLCVLLLILILFSAWLWSEIGATERSLIDSQGAIKDVVVAGYSRILDSSEIDESLNAVAERNALYVREEIKRVRKVWIVLCVGLIAFFSLGSLLAEESVAKNPPTKVSAPVGEKAIQGGGLTGCLWPNTPSTLRFDRLNGAKGGD